MVDLANPIIAIAAVFAAGLISSASPCSLFTIPLIIGYVTGYSKKDVVQTTLLSLFFTLGLAITFTVLGTIAGLLGTLLGNTGLFLKYLLSFVCVFMGLQVLGIININIPQLNIVKTDKKGVVGALFLGMLFGLATSPCSTPMLAVVLAYVASKQNIFYGTMLLFVYALGYCALIFIVGSFTGLAQTVLRSEKFHHTADYLKRISGIILVLIGIYLLLR